MSSNFYASSHNQHHLYSRPSLHSARAIDRLYATPHQLYCLGIWFANLIQKLGKRLNLRQIPIATATVYFKRFYLKSSYCETNPYLVLAACVFVAAKVEETPVHIKSVVSEAKVVFGEYNITSFPAEPNKLGEMEFYLLEDLDFHLVIFHPYRSLLAMCGREPSDRGRFNKSRMEEDSEIRKKEVELKKKRDEEIRKAGPGKGVGSGSGSGPSSGFAGSAGGATATPAASSPGVGAMMATTSSAGTGPGSGSGGDSELKEETEEARLRRLMSRGSGEGLMDIDEGVLQISLFLLNDTYRTDVHLLYPPHIIALSALYIGFTLSSMTPQSTRTRSSSSQITTNAFSSASEMNAALNLPPPPSGAAEFLASFEVNLGVVMSCVQDLVVLYPIWEKFEPSGVRLNTNQGSNSNSNSNSTSSAGSNSNANSGVYGNTTTRPNPTTSNSAAGQSRPGTGSSSSSRQNAGMANANEQKREAKFGPEEAEALVRRMIEERMVDVGHPDNAGKEGRDVQSTRSGAGGQPQQLAGKKRQRP